ncbi:pheromone A receptor-domain-containing protein [Mycena vitilis]|nr:pheromone A receptor-domain-containing protein [Mycena vitilis]
MSLAKPNSTPNLCKHPAYHPRYPLLVPGVAFLNDDSWAFHDTPCGALHPINPCYLLCPPRPSAIIQNASCDPPIQNTATSRSPAPPRCSASDFGDRTPLINYVSRHGNLSCTPCSSVPCKAVFVQDARHHYGLFFTRPVMVLCRAMGRVGVAKPVSALIRATHQRRAVLIDSVIFGLFPALYIALQYIVQCHRYDLLQDIGCFPALYTTLPTYFLSSIWPLLIGLASAYYCVRSLRAFAAHRAAFAQLLSAHSALTPSRYLRLSALALTDMLLTAPLAAFTIALNATASPISPWLSWADTHFDFGRVVQIPRLAWAGAPDGHAARGASGTAIELTRWASPACALIFVGFFVFAQEARRNYGVLFARMGAAFWRVLARAGLARPTAGVFAEKGKGAAGGGKGIGYTKPAPSFKRTVDVDISLPAYSPSAGTGSFTAGELKRAPSSSSSFGTSSFSASTYAYPADASRTHGRGGGGGSEGGASRFHEDFVVVAKDEIEVSSVYSAAGYWSADGHGHEYSPPSPSSSARYPPSSSSSSAHARPLSSSAPHAYVQLELDPASPLSATSSSFTHTASSFARTSTGSALPPHVAWAEEAYPASPRSVAHPYANDAEYECEYAVEEDGAREEGRAREEGEWEEGRKGDVSMEGMQARARTNV